MVDSSSSRRGRSSASSRRGVEGAWVAEECSTADSDFGGGRGGNNGRWRGTILFGSSGPREKRAGSTIEKKPRYLRDKFSCRREDGKVLGAGRKKTRRPESRPGREKDPPARSRIRKEKRLGDALKKKLSPSCGEEAELKADLAKKNAPLREGASHRINGK